VILTKFVLKAAADRGFYQLARRASLRGRYEMEQLQGRAKVGQA